LFISHVLSKNLFGQMWGLKFFKKVPIIYLKTEKKRSEGGEEEETSGSLQKKPEPIRIIGKFLRRRTKKWQSMISP
jgi:hypothetical protein